MLVTYKTKKQRFISSSEKIYANHVESISFTLSEIIKTHYLSDSEHKLSYWNKFLVEINTHNGDVANILSSLIEKSEQSEEYAAEYRYKAFFRKANGAHTRYLGDSKNNKLKLFHEPSANSLLQLVRFIPYYPGRNVDVYLDEMTGCFGVTISSNAKGRPILNLLMRENREVIFSFVKRRNKIIKISGRAYFNDDLNDSDEIKNIIRMISE